MAKDVKKFDEMIEELLTLDVELYRRVRARNRKESEVLEYLEKVKLKKEELIKMYEGLEQCADDDTPKNEENLFKHLKKNKDLEIRFSFFSFEEGDLIPVKISNISIEHAHIHNDIEFDDEDEYLNYLECESGYDKKTIKKFKNEFHFSPFLQITLEEKI